MLLCDGARAIWKYADGNERYDDYENRIDYYHALEHLSLAAGALFGKDSAREKTWYDKYHKKLLDRILARAAFFIP